MPEARLEVRNSPNGPLNSGASLTRLFDASLTDTLSLTTSR
jgi:hypothetical protein